MANRVFSFLHGLLLFTIIILTKGQEYDYLNCYYDLYNDRILRDLTDCSDTPACDCSTDLPYCSSNSMTLELCENICRRKNFKYFGVQTGNQCFCGGEFSSTVDWYVADPGAESSRCRTPCEGNTGQLCGGDYLMRVYRFKEPLGSSKCFHPGQPRNPSVSQETIQDYFFDGGDTISYACVNRGDRLIGVQQISCFSPDPSSGYWDARPPTDCECCAARCNSEPDFPDDALRAGSPYPDGYFEGDVVNFFCTEDFKLFTVTCTYTGTWTDPGNPCITPTEAPVCPPIYCNTINCEYGLVQDSNGCSICQCVQPPFVPTDPNPTTTRHVCAPINSCNLYCPYGLQVDLLGCTTCQCVPPPFIPTTKPTTTMPTTTTQRVTSRKPVIETMSPRTTKNMDVTATKQMTDSNATETSVTVIPSDPSLDPTLLAIFIAIGAAVAFFIIVVAVVACCTQCRRAGEKALPKGPAPPPRDYPTIDLKNPGALGMERRDSVYDFIKEPKRKKKRKNSYVQNDIQTPPSPPPDDTGSRRGSRSLNGSMMGTLERPDFNSLSKSLTGSLHHGRNGTQRSTGTQRSNGTHRSGSSNMSGGSHRGGSRTQSQRRGSGLNTPSSQRLNRAMTGSVSSSHNSNWSIASHNSQSLNRSMARGGGRSRKQSYTDSISRSVASGGSTSPLLSSTYVNAPAFSRTQSLQSVYNNIPQTDDDSTYQEPIVSSRVDWTNGSISRSMTSGSESGSNSGRPSAQSLNRAMASHTPLSTRSVTQSNFTRTQSMYGNLPQTPHGEPMTGHGSLDGINHTYMNSLKKDKSSDRPRPPRKVPSKDIGSAGRNQERMRNPSSLPRTSQSRRLGPKLRINTSQNVPSHSSRRHRPPDSPFGDDHQELTTPL